MLWFVIGYLLVAVTFYGYIIATAMPDPYEHNLTVRRTKATHTYKRLHGAA